jgi:DivIVA domain-containing protein
MSAEPERRVAGQHDFTVALRGYKPAEVDQALAELRARVDDLVAERNSLSAQKNQLASQLLSAIRRTNELSMQVEHLSASAASTDGLSERIRVILELASEEGKAITAQARELEAERTLLLTSARAQADRLQREAVQAARAHHDEAQADAERILGEASTAAKAVLEEAHRSAAADVDQLRESLLTELPQRLNAVIDAALGHLPGPVEGAANGGEPVDAAVVPQQRQPQTSTPDRPARQASL